MLNITLTDSKGNSIPVNVPTSWQDVTVLQFAQIQGEERFKQIAILLDIPLEQVLHIELNSFTVLLDAMRFLEDPLPAVNSDEFPTNYGMESIGQLELAKKFVLALESNNMWFAAPYIYAIYLWPDRYDVEAAFGVSGFPTNLILEAQTISIVKMYNAIVFFSLNSAGFETHLRPYLTGSQMLRRRSPESTVSTNTDSLPLW